MAITQGEWGPGPLASTDEEYYRRFLEYQDRFGIGSLEMGKLCPDCDREVLRPLPHADAYRCPMCLRVFTRLELEHLKHRRREPPLKVEIASSSGEDLGKVFGGNVIKKAQEAYVENRAYYKDAPPETGGASAIALKKSIEAAVVQMEEMLSTILVEGEDDTCHASARIQFKIARVDIEVWETRGKGPKKS